MRSAFRSSFVALQHRNFRLLWAGLLFSFSGSFMQSAALLWHVSLLVPPDRKGLALGMVGLVRIVPIALFSLFSGVVADAWDRRRMMLLTQGAAAIVSASLALLAWHGVETVWPIYLCAALGSMTDAFERPARQSLLPSLVPREHLPNALSLHTTMLQLALVCGPAIGGIVIATTGVAAAYAINAVSFLVLMGCVAAIRDIPERPPAERAADDVSFRAAIEGLRFVFRSPIIRSTMLLDFFATFFASATALLPIFAQDVLHVGARGYGWLYAAPATGAFVTSIAMLPIIDRLDRRGQTLLAAVGVYGLSTIVFGLSTSFWLSFAALAAGGAADIVSTVIRNVIRHLETPDRLRGRMVGIMMVFFMGGPQLGELEAGLVAQWRGAVFSVVTGGLGCIGATLWLGLSTPALWRYRKTTGPSGDARAAKGAADAVTGPMQSAG